MHKMIHHHACASHNYPNATIYILSYAETAGQNVLHYRLLVSQRQQQPRQTPQAHNMLSFPTNRTRLVHVHQHLYKAESNLQHKLIQGTLKLSLCWIEDFRSEHRETPKSRTLSIGLLHGVTAAVTAAVADVEGRSAARQSARSVGLILAGQGGSKAKETECRKGMSQLHSTLMMPEAKRGNLP